MFKNKLAKEAKRKEQFEKAEEEEIQAESDGEDEMLKAKQKE